MPTATISAKLIQVDGVWTITITGKGMEDEKATFASKAAALAALKRVLAAGRKLQDKGIVTSITTTPYTKPSTHEAA